MSDQRIQVRFSLLDKQNSLTSPSVHGDFCAFCFFCNKKLKMITLTYQNKTRNKTDEVF